MKRITLNVFIFVFGFFLFSADAATIKKGIRTIGGDADMQYQSATYDESSESDGSGIELGIDYGIFFQDNIEGGMSLLYSRNDSDSLDTVSYGIGVFINYHFPLNENINLIAGAGTGILEMEFDAGPGFTEERYGFGFDLHGGMACFLNPSVAIILNVKYSRTKVDYDFGYDSFDDHVSRVGLETGIKVFF